MNTASILNSAGPDEQAVRYFLDRLARHLNEALTREREEEPTIQ